MKFPTLICIALAGFAFNAHAEREPLMFNGADKLPVEQTALIRPATKEEKTEKPASMGMRLLIGNFSGTAPLPSIDAISIVGERAEQDGPIESLGMFQNSIRVPAGRYLVQAKCTIGGFIEYFKMPVLAAAGKVYLFECFGMTAHKAKMQVREFDPNTSTAAAPAASAASTAAAPAALSPDAATESVPSANPGPEAASKPAP